MATQPRSSSPSPSKRQFLLVTFDEPRDVLVDGVVVGQTNNTVTLESGPPVVSLAPPDDFSPRQLRAILRNTTAARPIVVRFKRGGTGPSHRAKEEPVESSPPAYAPEANAAPTKATSTSETSPTDEPRQLQESVLPDFAAVDVFQTDDALAVEMALAAAVNQLNRRRGIRERASFKMIEALARQDTNAEGSLARLRAALRGLTDVGVCREELWAGALTPQVLEDARGNRLKSLRVVKTDHTDLQVALREHGVVVVHAIIHDGWRGETTWSEPGIIPFTTAYRRPHVFLLVGYTARGFIVQNSWGTGWGGVELAGQLRPGLAVWPYKDVPASDMHAWVMELPGAHRRWSLSYDRDEATGRRDGDYLDIGTDVDALASLIALRTLSPPLSIGLFGDWGSGKTFFMRALKETVAVLARAARDAGQPQKQLAFYKQIVQIEFNAWHYVQGDLWAGLVERIFEGLRIYDDEPTSAVDQRRDFWLNEIKKREEAVVVGEAAQRTTAADVIRAEQEVKQLNTSFETGKTRFAELKGEAEDVWRSVKVPEGLRKEITATLDAVGITATVDAASDLHVALGQARAVLDRGNRLLTPLLHAPDRGRRLLMLLLLVAAPLLAGVGVAHLVDHAQAGWLSGAATLLGSGTLWIRTQAGWLSDWLQRAERAQQRLDERVTERRAQQARELAEVEKSLEMTRTKYAAAVSESAESRRRVQEARAELAATTAGRLLATYIEDRAASADYRKHLGLLALVRRDFEYMSKLIATENKSLEKASLEEEAKNAQQRINRIVLYIDDLDRCPPEKVVQVLQAVHLLGTFPLFVIVVAVDARWVSRALTSHYKDMLGDGANVDGLAGQATPHDYLEKVFQVPFWVRAMTTHGAGFMLSNLLHEVITTDGEHPRIPVQQDATAQQKAGAAPTASAGSSIADLPSGSGGAEGTTGTTGGGAERHPGPRDAAILTRSAPVELDPDRLRITPAELEFMQELRLILGRSPRALKRFVNCYRLIKASVPTDRQDDFLSGTGATSPFRAVLFLLAIVTGSRFLARPLFTDLKRKNPGRSTPQLATLEMVANVMGAEADSAEMEVLSNWLQTHNGGAWKQAPIHLFVEWAPNVARYSFRTETLT